MAIFVTFFLLALAGVHAADPDLTTDFARDSASVDASFFTFTGFRSEVSPPANKFLVKKASVLEFPALEGLGVSIAKLTFQPNSINPPHLHPRGTELLFVEDGWLTVGLIDSTNKLFLQKLQKGDVFVFPKGLVHFQVNEGTYAAKAISSFSSSNAGTVSLPATLFSSNISDEVLQKAFKVSPEVIKALKSAVTTN